MSSKKQTLKNKQQQKSERQLNQNVKIIQIDDEESKQSFSISDKSLNENNAENFIDSLQQQEDYLDQNKQQEQQKVQPINDIEKLIKKNEKLFCNLRGAHSQVDIIKLTRLSNSSYVYFDEKQNFSTEFQDVLNRFYKSIPYDKDKKGGQDEIQFNTKFHQNLFDLEDDRFSIDVEILSLQRQLKQKKQNQTIDQNIDSILSIQKKLDLLQQQKRELDVQQKEEEKKCFYLSIDQQYHLKFEKHLKFLTPRFIQISSQSIYDDLMLKNENKSFQIYPYNKQPQWLIQYQEKYNSFKLKDKQLCPPLYFYSFQDKNALKITSHLILTSIQQQTDIQDNYVIEIIFIDLIKVLFNIDVPKSDHLFNTELLNEEIINILISQQKQNMINQNEHCKPSPTPDDPQKKRKDKFYPNFQKEEHIMYGRPIFECSLRIMYEIYLRIQKITQIQTIITYKNKEYTIGNLILKCFYQQLEEQITNVTWFTICKSIFNEQDSIEILSIIKLVSDFLKIFYKYDEFTFELLKNKIYNILGDNSKMVKENVDFCKMSGSKLLQKYKKELKNKKMTRVQTIDGLMIIHVYEFN